MRGPGALRCPGRPRKGHVSANWQVTTRPPRQHRGEGHVFARALAV